MPRRVILPPEPRRGGGIYIYIYIYIYTGNAPRGGRNQLFNCRQTDKQTGTQADKTNRQTGRQRQIGRQADRVFLVAAQIEVSTFWRPARTGSTRKGLSSVSCSFLAKTGRAVFWWPPRLKFQLFGGLLEQGPYGRVSHLFRTPFW